MHPIQQDSNYLDLSTVTRPIESNIPCRSLCELMNLSDNEWNERNSENLLEKIQQYCTQHVPEGQTEQKIGLIEKHDLQQGSQIAVLGEIDVSSLNDMDITLERLQRNGYLDENYKCKQDHHVVFLCPPISNVKAFELILTLKMENKNQIHLLSSNDVSWGEDDETKSNPFFMANLDKIVQFHKCLPKKVFLGQRSDGKKHYIQFSHDISWFDSDPSYLLDNNHLDHLWIKNAKTLSHRIHNNPSFLNEFHEKKEKEKMLIAALNLSKLFLLHPYLNNDYKFDIGLRFYCDKQLQVGSIPIEIIKHYLSSCSLKNKVKAVFLGKKYKADNIIQDIFTHKTLNDKTAAITINPSYSDRFNIVHLVVNKKVKDWNTYVTKHYLNNKVDTIDLSWRPFFKNKQDIALRSMIDLMELPSSEWKNRNINFLKAKIVEYLDNCIPPNYTKTSVSFIEKYNLEPESKIAVIGDIHGNDLRLNASLEVLRNKNFLNEKYQCNPLHHIVFLGDYVDRGENNLKVLEKLITIKLENKDQVHLIRGNHEDMIQPNNLDHYSKNDNLYYNYRLDLKNDMLLNTFFSHLPCSAYLGQKDEYVQYSHGGVHFKTDPTPILENERTQQWINDPTEFSAPIQSLINVENVAKTRQEKKWQKAAAEIDRVSKKNNISFKDHYWLDLGKKELPLDEYGRTQISLKSLHGYLILSGKTKKIKCLVRGHQHMVNVHRRGKTKKVIAITLDPSDDELNQTIMIMKTHPKFSHWENSFLTCPLTNPEYPTLNCIPYEMT